MTMLFSQSRYGRVVELQYPKRSQVDLRESCNALADLNRFAGATSSPVSVAFHTLIGLDMCPVPLQPWWVLHDFHEAPLGEWITPAQHALEEVAFEYGGSAAKRTVRESMKYLKRRHDAAIYSAAGLPLPNETQREAIRRLDLRCLVTERRDFMGGPAAPWGEETEQAIPSPIYYIEGHFGAKPIMVAQKLYLRLTKLLPALKGNGARRFGEWRGMAWNAA